MLKSRKRVEARWAPGRRAALAVAGFLCGAGGDRARAGESWQAPETVAVMKNPVGSTEGGIAQGRKIYETRCADCHGAKGKGDGPAAADLDPKPGDLSRAAMNGQSDGALFWKVSEGRKPMPTYKSKLSDEQRWQVVTYVRTLAGKK